MKAVDFSSARVAASFLAGIVCLAWVATSQASTLQEPGFTEIQVDTIAAATNGFGGMVTDADGNLYFAANEADEVYIVPEGGTASVFGVHPGSTALGVEIIGSDLYSSFGDGTLYVQDLTQPNPVATTVASGLSTPMGLAVVPPGFGAFGGQLALGVSGGVVIVDPGTATVTPLWNSGTEISDVAFTLDGRLLATRQASGELVEITAAGVATVFASGLGAVDGIAVRPGTGEIFVADPDSSTLFRVSADGATVTPFATNAAVDGGFFPTPITFTVDGSSLFYATREANSSVIYRIDGFSAVSPAAPVAVPVVGPMGLLLLVLAVFGAGWVRLRR